MSEPDLKAILLLCSYLGLDSNPDPAPLKPKDWSLLARKLYSAALRPGYLFSASMTDLSQLGLGDELVHRIFGLLQRSETLESELERLKSLDIQVLTRGDKEYPKLYKKRLVESSPTVLFYIGNKELLNDPGIAIVGSRQLDKTGQECAELLGNACGLSGRVLFSGGARGVDFISMQAALKTHNAVVGVLADNLEKAIHEPAYRDAIAQRNLCLVTPYSPNAPFMVGKAMGRNKLIYTLAQYAIIIASDLKKGGTWAGATEALNKD